MSGILGDLEGYTIKQAAEQTGISAKTLRRQVVKGEIPAAQVETVFGLTYVLDREVVAKLKDNRQTVTEIVKVKRPADSTSLALVVTKALEDALDRRDHALLTRVEELTAQVAELTEELRRPFWQRLTGRGPRRQD